MRPDDGREQVFDLLVRHFRRSLPRAFHLRLDADAADGRDLMCDDEIERWKHGEDMASTTA